MKKDQSEKVRKYEIDYRNASKAYNDFLKSKDSGNPVKRSSLEKKLNNAMTALNKYR